ncbi:OmpA family protein [Hymenobacter actinosclerus]|uniref:WD40-like Beta Propeller Repeat n=1 Tax=Hymenobacter actinosclerus TaxID=82805 RepID=A0A1I0GUU1_9BACT|nr:OmpA family protein [Hymenobacter actinosclerus]SET74195.1 WD40-like Beta Propeller Repeat [Hymenobacter actinosclerus]
MFRFAFLFLVGGLLLALGRPVPAAAQQKPPTYAQRPLSAKVIRQLRARPDATPVFPNVNRLAYFRDKKALRAIQQAEKRKNWPAARNLLETYVGQFGIENFYRDTPLLWRLGQLWDKAGDEQRARAYFRLALKHRRQSLTKVQQYYDSLEQKETELYVPLQKYYELVEYRKSIATFRPPKGVYTSMGEAINSDKEDYGPTLNADANLLYFTSKRKTRGRLQEVSDEDIYQSRFENGLWTEAEALPKPINSSYNEGSACITKDGKTLYFARCECPTCQGNCDLYESTLRDGKWTMPKSLGPNVNSPAWDSQPTLSPGEDTLYFASDRLGGFGLSDIWFTVKNKAGQWLPAQNMGPVVNTRESEVSPFYHPLYHVLYFSSRGQLLNFGDFDIYKTYRTRGRWQEPINIGPLVNGKGSEYYFTIDADSKNLYYARSEQANMKNLDLYSFPLPMEAQPTATTHVEGSLIDSVSRKPLNGLVSIIDTDNGIEVASKYLRDDGTFDFDLMEGSHYVMLIQSPDFFSVEKSFALKNDTVFQLMTNAIDYQLPMVFQNIEFDQDKATIRAAMHPTLDRITTFLVDHPTFRLNIAGHTDSRGDIDFNLKLSQDRAEAIRRYIEQKGKLPPNRVESMGYGSEKPLKEERTREDARTNRRVEFRIIKPAGDEQFKADPAPTGQPAPKPAGGDDGW